MTITRDPVDMDPIAELTWLLDKGGRVPLWWVVKWSDPGADPLARAWADSRHGFAMLSLLTCWCASHGVKHVVTRIDRKDLGLAQPGMIPGAVVHVTWTDGKTSRLRCAEASARVVRQHATPTFSMITQRSG
jgi:hypothetical protein